MPHFAIRDSANGSVVNEGGEAVFVPISGIVDGAPVVVYIIVIGGAVNGACADKTTEEDEEFVDTIVRAMTRRRSMLATDPDLKVCKLYLYGEIS